MGQPTKEEVESKQYAIVFGRQVPDVPWLSRLFDAYLALMEEVEEKTMLLNSYGEMLHQSGQQTDSAIEQIAQLKSENQALQETNRKMRDKMELFKIKEVW